MPTPSEAPAKGPAPVRIDLRQQGESVPLYERSGFPFASIGAFLAAGILEGMAALVIATDEHRAGIEADLARRGLAVAALRGRGQLIFFDVAELLSRLMREGAPDPFRFSMEIEGELAELERVFGRVRVYGEMVDLLWREGYRRAAELLDELWNDLRRRRPVSRLGARRRAEGDPNLIERIGAWRPQLVCGDTRGAGLGEESSVTLDGLRLLDLLPAAVYLCDRNGHIRFYNRKAEEVWGRPPCVGEHAERFSGANRLYWPDGRDLPHDESATARCLESGEPVLDCEGVAERPDGSRVTVMANAAPLRDERGELLGAITVFHDISARIVAENELRARDEEIIRSGVELARFAKIASFDIQEPLGMIRALCFDLHAKLSDHPDAEVRWTVDCIRGSARKAHDLIDALLSYASAGADAAREMFDAGAMLEGALQSLSQVITETGALVTNDPLPSIVGNSALFGQLMSNLLSNALKFRGERRPVIHVGVMRNETEWVFSVSDNGIGIEPRYLERVFVPYERWAAAQEYPGLGIGLAVCRKIVEWHKGRIWVESRLGQGSTFHFTIPR